MLYAAGEQIENFFAIGVSVTRVGLAVFLCFEDDAAQSEALDIALRTARQPSQMTPRFVYAVLATLGGAEKRMRHVWFRLRLEVSYEKKTIMQRLILPTDPASAQGSATKVSIVVPSALAIRDSVAAEPGLRPRSISER